MFSLICAWTNSWADNRIAGDLKHHCEHYDVTVMEHVRWRKFDSSWQVFMLIRVFSYSIRILEWAQGCSLGIYTLKLIWNYSWANAVLTEDRHRKIHNFLFELYTGLHDETQLQIFTRQLIPMVFSLGLHTNKVDLCIHMHDMGYRSPTPVPHCIINTNLCPDSLIICSTSRLWI